MVSTAEATAVPEPNLAKMKISDSTAVASWDAIKAADKVDVEARNALVASITLASFEALSPALIESLLNTNKKFAAGREQAAEVFFAAIEKFGSQAEPAVSPALRALLACTGDAVRNVQTAATKTVQALFKIMCPYAFKTVLPHLLDAMAGKNKWQTIVGACNILSEVAASENETVQESVRCAMADSVPVLLPLLTDFKPEIAAASLKALETCCTLVSNRDLEPLLPVVLVALRDIKERGETVLTLASTTFVSTVNTASLAIIMPLLVSGFGERVTAIKRMCARIVVNMLKLVEDPMEAKPFLPELDVALTKQKNEVSDPEARGVCEQAHAQIVRLTELLNERPPMANTETRTARAVELLTAGATGAAASSVAYSAGILASLMETNEWSTEAWATCMTPYLGENAALVESTRKTCKTEFETKTQSELDDEADDGEELCNCKFTLAYGSKILLHNTDMRLKRGQHYGLLGGNDSGKTTLLRAISNDQVDGFPPSTVLKTVFVEADILGDLSHLTCLEYVFQDERIQACGIAREKVEETLATVGFTEDGKARPNDPVSTLSGGWRMKLALARAMLQNADILLMDEPTNHLDVINVEWVINYLKQLRGVTSIIVSHDKKLLNQVCSYMLQIDNLKLKTTRGNLDDFIKRVPTAIAYFDYKKTKLSFKFPQPGPIEGVKNKGRALMKMDDVEFTYPGNEKPTISGITVRASLASRVACVGVNGAGKSTMIKLLTGELEPCKGTVWKHPACRVGYIAQHAFHHIEQHLNKTANEYIQWRYQGGEDKETLEKVTFNITEEEQKKCEEPVTLELTDGDGKTYKEKRVVEKLTGARRAFKKEHEYEIKWAHKSMDDNTYMSTTALTAMGFEKHMKKIDEREALRSGVYVRPVTKKNVEEHLNNVGLAPEFGTHHRMSALSGGQKVKVVLAASLWNQPHILILDEPTNYLDRESLGALAEAIRGYDGGVIMITHNNDFCSDLCPETWVLEHGTLNCKGDAEWMANALKEKVDEANTGIQAMDEPVDALGNKVKVKSKKKLSNKEKKAKAKQRAFKIANGLDVSSDEDFD